MFVLSVVAYALFFFFSSRRRHTRSDRDWSSDVCSSDLGGNSELHTVDERIVGHMPKTLGFADAAALPLTAKIGRASCRERV